MKIFCDGAYQLCKLTEEKVGGFGIVVVNKNNEEIEFSSEKYKNTTNNRMELRGFLTIFSMYGDLIKNSDDKVTIYSDSNYVVSGYNKWLDGWIKNNWKTYNRKPVENLDLWKKVVEYKELFQDKIIVEWIKGHQIEETELSKYNDLADKLANDACQQDKRSILDNYE